LACYGFDGFEESTNGAMCWVFDKVRKLYSSTRAKECAAFTLYNSVGPHVFEPFLLRFFLFFGKAEWQKKRVPPARRRLTDGRSPSKICASRRCAQKIKTKNPAEARFFYQKVNDN